MGLKSVLRNISPRSGLVGKSEPNPALGFLVAGATGNCGTGSGTISGSSDIPFGLGAVAGASALSALNLKAVSGTPTATLS